jgi:hypothetical protein
MRSGARRISGRLPRFGAAREILEIFILKVYFSGIKPLKK